MNNSLDISQKLSIEDISKQFGSNTKQNDSPEAIKKARMQYKLNVFQDTSITNSQSSIEVIPDMRSKIHASNRPKLHL